MGFKKGSLYVLIANVINLLISLFTGFVLPKLLSIETYSNIKLFQLYITYIGVVSFGFADGMYLRLGGKDIKDLDSRDILAEFKTFKIFQGLVMLLAIIFSIVIKNEMLLFCSLIIVPINSAGYLRNLYQAIGKFDLYSKFMNINTILIFIINIFLVLIIKTNNYYIYIIGYIIAYFMYWGYIELETQKNIGKKKNNSKINYLITDIKSGFFLMIGNFCNVIFTGIDRIFVQNLLGIIKFAFYSFAVSIENLMNVFITPISTVMYNYLCNNKNKENVIRIKRIILLFSTIIITVIFPAKFIVVNWLEKYIESLSVLFILFASQYISIIIKCIHINMYKAEKRQNKYFLIMIIIVVISIILNFVFYNINKCIEMIALATLLTNIIWFIIGEVDLIKYRLNFKEYIYIFLILIVFLLTGKIENALIGCFIYIIISGLLILIFMRNTFKYCLKEIIYSFKKINKKEN